MRVEHGRAQKFDTLDNGGSMNDRNAIGAIAEYALAKHFGKTVLVDWCECKSFVTTREAIRAIPCDLGKNIHVRATSNPRARLLIVHEPKGRAEEPVERRRFRPSDPPDGVFVFATVLEPTLTVVYHGWQNSGWVQNCCTWNTKGPGFFRQDRHAYTCDIDDLLEMSSIPPEAIA